MTLYEARIPPFTVGDIVMIDRGDRHLNDFNCQGLSTIVEVRVLLNTLQGYSFCIHYRVNGCKCDNDYPGCDSLPVDAYGKDPADRWTITPLEKPHPLDRFVNLLEEQKENK